MPMKTLKEKYDVKTLTKDYDISEIKQHYLELNKNFFLGTFAPSEELTYKVFAWGDLNLKKNKIDPSHFTMSISSAEQDLIHISHSSRGLGLLHFGTLVAYNPENKYDYPNSSGWKGTVFLSGKMTGSLYEIVETVLRHWWYFDQLKSSDVFPASCSGVVATVLYNHADLFLNKSSFYKEADLTYGQPFPSHG